MLVSGLWHGAAWTFVVWGGLHGIGLIVHKIWRTRVHIKSKVWDVISVILTDCFAFLCWVFFRADSFNNAADVLRTAFIPYTGIIQPYTWTSFAIAVLAISTIVMTKQQRTGMGTEMDYPMLDLKTVPGLTCFFVFCGLTIGMAYVGDTAFIYGAF